jgi:MFS transporter, PPP family, 3-phenylpropionic acid transporter
VGVTSPSVPTASARASATSIAAPAVVYVLQFTAIAVWVAYATVYFQSLGVDLAAIGLLAAVPSVISIVAAPIWGLVADRLGDMRPPYLAGAVIAAACGLTLLLQPSMPWLLLAVVGLAVGASGLGAMLDARTVQRLWPDRERFGQARAFGSIAFMACTILVGGAITGASVRLIWIVYAVAFVAAGVAAYGLLGRQAGGPRVAGVGPRAGLRLLRDPGLGLFFAGSTLAWMASAGALTLFSLRVVDLGGTTADVGMGWAVNAALEVPLMLAFQRISRRVRVEPLIVVGLFVFALRSALWAAAGSPLAFVLAAATSGAGYALVYVGTTAFVAGRVPAQLQATAQALFSSTSYAIGSIGGAVLAGQVARAAGLGAVYPAAAVLSLIAAVLVWVAILPRGRGSAGHGRGPAG